MSFSPASKLGKFANKLEFKLVAFLAYVGALVYAALMTGKIWPLFFTHLAFVLIFGLIYFFQEFIAFLLSPLLLIFWPIQNFLVRRYLKKFQVNVPADAVVILGHSAWYTLEGWTKPIFFKQEIRALIKVFAAQDRKFSFYPDATLKDVETIMANPNVKEVYFFGHGDTHSFQLGTDEILFYCDFNDKRYAKEFVHQVHCGTRFGKSLIDYVVPEGNRSKCFLFKHKINGHDIVKEFKRKADIALKDK